jgi:hypothetical protein
MRIENYAGANAGSPNFNFYSANGTQSSPQGTNSGDNIGQFAAAGYIPVTGFPGSKAKINFFATETWSATANGTGMAFATTAAGSTKRTARVVIDANGNVGINNGSSNNPNTTDKLFVNGNIHTAGGVVFPDNSIQTTAYTGASSGGVTSFNGRTGAVTPAANDYSFSQLSGTATDAQLTALSASKLTGTVAIAQGGTGSATQNFVDLTTAQTIAGAKTFSSPIAGSITGNAATATTATTANALSGNIPESQVTNLTTDLGNKLTASSPLPAANLTGTVPTAVLTGTYNVSVTGNAATATTATTAGSVTGVVAIAHGGTGSATQNFVDLTTAQSVGGVKTFAASPLLPDPSTATQAANKEYVDNSVSPLNTTVTSLGGSVSTLQNTLTSLSANAAQVNEANVFTPSQVFLGGLNFFTGSTASITTNASNPNGLDLYTGGAERLTINPQGSVGINTTSPQATLDVNGSVAIEALGKAVSGQSYLSQPLSLTDSEWLGGTVNQAESSTFQWQVIPPPLPNPLPGAYGTLQLNFIGNGGAPVPVFSVDPAGNLHASGALSLGASNGIPATSLQGVLPIASGGTGSATQNFVDLVTDQAIAGNKTFIGVTTAAGISSTASNPGASAIQGTSAQGQTTGVFAVTNHSQGRALALSSTAGGNLIDDIGGKFRVNSNGNVGIGNASIQAALDVYPGGSNSGVIVEPMAVATSATDIYPSQFLTMTASGYYPTMSTAAPQSFQWQVVPTPATSTSVEFPTSSLQLSYVDMADAWKTILSIDASGNITPTGSILFNGGQGVQASSVTGVLPLANGGTGATSRQAALNALAGAQSAGTYLRSDGSNTTLSQIQSSDLPSGIAYAYSNIGFTGQYDAFAGMVIVDSGNVGAGALSSALTPGLTFGNTNGGAGISGEGIASNRASTTAGNQYGLDFYTDFTKRLSVANNGNVGVGTVSPAALLEVNGLSRIKESSPSYPSTGAGMEIYAQSSGNIGGHIQSYDRTASAWHPFYLDAQNIYLNKSSNGNVVIGNGCLQNGSGTTIAGSCSSDERLKTDITPFPAVLDKVARLQPVHYRWRADEHPEYQFGDGVVTGLIAQQVEQVFPELVTTDANGFRKVNYTELPYLLLESVRELKAENDGLQSQLKKANEQLQSTLDRQSETLNALAARLAELEQKQK